MTRVVRSSKGQVPVHALRAGRVVCGGGPGARKAKWREVQMAGTCLRCSAILLSHVTQAAQELETHQTNLL
jgi:hypothetical protein